MIQRNFDYLCDVIDTEGGLLKNLVAGDVLDQRELDEITSKPTSFDRNFALLMKLRIKSSLDFGIFVSSLERSNQQHVADVLSVEGVQICSQGNV